MTINGSTNNNAWTYKLEAIETSTSIQDRTSTIQIKAYLGRANSTSYLGGGYSVSVNCAGQSSTQSGTIPYPTYINGGGWLELKTFTFTVSNTDNPTTINISSTMSSGDFTPSYASASGNMNLTVLHLPPVINTATMVETNAVLTALSIPDTTVVRYLSKKTITLDAESFDSATLKYRLRHFNTDYALPSATTFQNSDTFSTDYTTHDVKITDGKAQIIQDVGDSLNGLTTDWVYVDINGTSQKPDGIAYAKPNLERTSTTIRRKSGNGTNLTDNKANVNVVGTIYKDNNAIGNNNFVTQIGYKVWEDGTSEPANYTSLTPTISGGNVTVTDYEISNIVFTKIYNYKIILTDNYGYNYVVEGTIPLGQPTWSEYKDRVDFLKITKQGKEVFSNEYSTSNEEVVGKWIDDSPIYRKVLGSLGTISATGSKTFSVSILSINNLLKIDGTINYLTDYVAPLSRITPYYDTNNEEIIIYNDKSYAIDDGFVYIEYTKT